jgi:hypothetical protein
MARSIGGARTRLVGEDDAGRGGYVHRGVDGGGERGRHRAAEAGGGGERRHRGGGGGGAAARARAPSSGRPARRDKFAAAAAGSTAGSAWRVCSRASPRWRQKRCPRSARRDVRSQGFERGFAVVARVLIGARFEPPMAPIQLRDDSAGTSPGPRHWPSHLSPPRGVPPPAPSTRALAESAPHSPIPPTLPPTAQPCEVTKKKYRGPARRSRAPQTIPEAAAAARRRRAPALRRPPPRRQSAAPSGASSSPWRPTRARRAATTSRTRS